MGGKKKKSTIPYKARPREENKIVDEQIENNIDNGETKKVVLKLDNVEIKKEKNAKIKVNNKEQKNNQNKKVQEVEEDESKYNTVSLKEIKALIQNRINEEQKSKIWKAIYVNVGIAISMLIFLFIIAMVSKNIPINILEKSIKVFALILLITGLIILEKSYKKDNIKMAINSIEVFMFGIINICLIYSIKLYFNNVINNIIYIALGIAGYYVLKIFLLVIKNVKKYKKENNDIKEIIKK